MSAAAPAKTMLLTWKVRLNLEPRQHRAMQAYALQDQQLYNAALEECLAAYRCVETARHEVAWRQHENKQGELLWERDGAPRGSYSQYVELTPKGAAATWGRPTPQRDLLRKLLGLGRQPGKAQLKRWKEEVAEAEAAGTAPPPPPEAGPKVGWADALNRRRWILAAVLTERLTPAQRLDMLERIEPLSAEARADLEAFSAGRGEVSASLAEELVAPPAPRLALTHGRLVAEMQRRWDGLKHSLSAHDQSRSLTVIRAEDPAYAVRQRRVQRNTINRRQKTYDAMFARGGRPKFKSARFAASFAFDAFQQISLSEGRTFVRRDAAGNALPAAEQPRRPRIVGRRLRFAGVPGGLRLMKDRPLPQLSDPDTGELIPPAIKSVHFKGEDKCLDRVNRWFCGLQVKAPCAPARQKGREIGIDWGTSVLAATSSGALIENPRFGEVAAAALARDQRRVARRPNKASRRRAKALAHKRRGERKTANRRRNHFNKVTKLLATRHKMLAYEFVSAKDLADAERPGEALPEFVKTRRNRENADAAPFEFRRMTGYKAELWGAEHRAVDPAAIVLADSNPLQPTQRCSMCGRLHLKESLAQAQHVCTLPDQPFFGVVLPRKVNAARVILLAARGEIALAPGNSENSPLAGDDRGGPVPGGAAPAANGGAGRRRLGKTAGEQSPTGWHSQQWEFRSHTHGPPPKPPPGRVGKPDTS